MENFQNEHKIELKYGREEITNSLNAAEMLNSFFSQKEWKKLYNKKKINSQKNQLSKQIINICTGTIFIFPVTAKEITVVTKNLKQCWPT